MRIFYVTYRSICRKRKYASKRQKKVRVVAPSKTHAVAFVKESDSSYVDLVRTYSRALYGIVGPDGSTVMAAAEEKE